MAMATVMAMAIAMAKGNCGGNGRQRRQRQRQWMMATATAMAGGNGNGKGNGNKDGNGDHMVTSTEKARMTLLLRQLTGLPLHAMAMCRAWATPCLPPLHTKECALPRTAPWGCNCKECLLHFRGRDTDSSPWIVFYYFLKLLFN